METIVRLIPEAELAEIEFLKVLLKDKSESDIKEFISIYRVRRRDPQVILLTGAVGFLGFAGIQRMLINQIGMGILYLLTLGLCFIGTIVDLVNHKNLTLEFNQKVAYQIRSFIE